MIQWILIKKVPNGYVIGEKGNPNHYILLIQEKDSIFKRESGYYIRREYWINEKKEVKNWIDYPEPGSRETIWVRENVLQTIIKSQNKIWQLFIPEQAE